MLHEVFARTGLVLVLFLLSLAAISVIVLFVATDGKWWNPETKTEFAKGAVQLLVVTLVGALVAVVLASIDRAREDARRDDEARLRVVHSVTKAYNQMKAVRRNIRALRFASERPESLEAQRVEFIAQMKGLNEAQLQLEMGKRETRVRSGALRSSDPSGRVYLKLMEHIEAMERYVNAIIDEWERLPGGAVPIDSSLAKMPMLRAFLDSPNETGGIRAGWPEPNGPGGPQDGPSAQLLAIEDLVSNPPYQVPPRVPEREDSGSVIR